MQLSRIVLSGGGRRERERAKGAQRKRMTWTMATCKRTPLRPTAKEAAAMTAGPARNLTAIAKAAMEFPHAMILGCKAMNRPVIHIKSISTPITTITSPPLSVHSVTLLKDLSSSPRPLPITVHYIEPNINMAKSERNITIFIKKPGHYHNHTVFFNLLLLLVCLLSLYF